MDKKNIYISGKITGLDNYAEVFEKKEKELTEQGHLVFNPAKHPDMFSWQQFMELDLKALSFCDSIYMMKGWETSKGATLELEEAKRLGIEIIYEESPKLERDNYKDSNNINNINSLEEVEKAKENFSHSSKLKKDYYQDFVDMLDDESLSDGDLLEKAKTYIFELQKIIQPEYKNVSEEIDSYVEDWRPPFIKEIIETSVNEPSISTFEEAIEPNKKGIAYKVFYLKDGKLYPPMVQNPNGEATPIGMWIEASAGEVAGTTKTGRPQILKGGKGTHTSTGLLAYRPGWHLGDVPIATQFSKVNKENGQKELFPAEFVWAECEYSNDIDYQQEAMSNGFSKNGAFRHSYAGLQKLPENGSYRYRTNPDPKTEEWIIAGKIKVKKILTQKEIKNLVKKSGKEPQKVENGSFVEIEDKVIAKMCREIDSSKDLEKLIKGEKPWEETLIERLDEVVKLLEKEEILKLKSLWSAKFGKDSNEFLCFLRTNVKDYYARSYSRTFESKKQKETIERETVERGY